MERTAVEWFAERISHGGLVSKKQFNELLNQAKEMEEKQSQDYAEFCINCDRRNYPILDFESYLKLKDNGKDNI